MFKQSQGFTIIEVLVAIFIIGIAIIGVVIGFSSGLTMVEEIRQTATADRIAQEVMEELRGGESISAIPSNIQREGVTYTISISPSTVEPALTQMTVSVSFNSHTGRSLSRNLVTYFTENGITKK